MSELFAWLRSRRKWWLPPIVLTLLLLSLVLITAELSGAGPFVYTLF